MKYLNYIGGYTFQGDSQPFKITVTVKYIVTFLLLTGYSGSLLSCKKGGVIHSTKYLNINLSSGNLVQINQIETYCYELVTQGLRIGIRRFPDDSGDPGGRKPAWYAYQAASTDQEDTVFDSYKIIIGIQNWNEIQHNLN